MYHEESDDKVPYYDSQLASHGSFPRNGRLNMRGSAPSAFATTGNMNSDANALSIAQSNDIAAQLQHLDQARLNMDKSLNELYLILNGDSASLQSLSNTYGLQEQAVEEILQYINTDIGQDVDNLNKMIRNEIQPMLNDVYNILEETIPESERRLTGIFEHQFDTGGDFAPSSSPSGSSSSPPPVRPGDNAKPSPPGGFEFLQGKSPNVENLLKKMLKETHIAGFFDATNQTPRGTGSLLSHHHRRRHGSVGRRTQHAKRRLEDNGSQDVLGTCSSCANIENKKLRKDCNCLDLFKCVKALTDTDIAVMLSRGLVDKDTGTIEVEKANLDNERLWAAGHDDDTSTLVDDNGNFRTEANTALDNLYDAGQLLAKINTIRGLATKEECDELLEEFHVPCRDWQGGCSGSDRRSYQLVSIVVAKLRLPCAHTQT